MRSNTQAYVQETSLSTSSAVNLPTIPNSPITYTVIAVEGAGIRWRDDGTDPTSSVGMPVSAGQTFSYTGDPQRVRVIGQTSGAAINCLYTVAS